MALLIVRVRTGCALRQRSLRANAETTLVGLFVLILFAAGVYGEPASGERIDEYRVKSAVLYSLTKFVDWPIDAFGDSSAPFVICVLGVDPFGAVLDETVRGHTIGQRAILAKRVSDVTPGCHVMFISDSERSGLPSLMDRLRHTTALTVGDADGFVDHGGMIGLRTQGDRVRLDINLAVAERANLKLSARLLALASVVRRESRP